MNKTEEQYDSLVRIEQKAANDSDRNIENANETERSLCGQLMLMSTVFLTVSVVVVGNSDSLNKIATGGRLLIISTFILVLLSIACGIKYYFESIKFYANWGKIHHEAYETFRDGLLGAGEVNVEELNKKSSSTSEVSSDKWLKRQIILLAGGAISCVILLFVVFVFSSNNDVPPNTNHLKGQHHRDILHTR